MKKKEIRLEYISDKHKKFGVGHPIDVVGKVSQTFVYMYKKQYRNWMTTHSPNGWTKKAEILTVYSYNDMDNH